MGSQEELPASLGRAIIAAVLGDDSALKQLIDVPPDVFAPDERAAWQYILGWYRSTGFSPGRAQFEMHYPEMKLPEPVPVEELVERVRQAAENQPQDAEPQEGPSEPRSAAVDYRHPSTSGSAPEQRERPLSAATATSRPKAQSRIEEVVRAGELEAGAVAQTAVARLAQEAENAVRHGAEDLAAGRLHVGVMLQQGASILELSRTMGISKQAISRKLRRLEARGVLRRVPGGVNTPDIWFTDEHDEYG